MIKRVGRYKQMNRDRVKLHDATYQRKHRQRYVENNRALREKKKAAASLVEMATGS